MSNLVYLTSDTQLNNYQYGLELMGSGLLYRERLFNSD